MDNLRKQGCSTEHIQVYVINSVIKNQHKCDLLVLDECFRGDTEILTDKGFKKFNTLNGDEKVAQFTDSGNIEFVKPLRFIKKQATDGLVDLTLERGRHCYLTPNHNQVYRTPRVPGWRVKPIKDLSSNSYTEIPVSGRGTGNNSPLTALERLLIAIQADGTLQRHCKDHSSYSIHVTKQQKKDRLLSILQEYGEYTPIKGRPETDRYMVRVPTGDSKLLSTHFDINMGYDRACAFIEEVLEWDGCKILGGNTVYYSSKVKENADFVTTIALQAGYKVLNSIESDSRKPQYSDIHRVYMRKTETITTQSFKQTHIPYEGEVYCVEVPSHKIVVRSEGYSFISGNCHRYPADSFSVVFQKVKYHMIMCLTATFERLDGKHTLLSRYAPVVDQVTIQECLANKWVSNYKEYAVVIEPADLEEYEKLTKEFTEHFEFFDYNFGLAMSMVGPDGWKHRNNYAKELCKEPAMLSNVLKTVTIHSVGLLRAIQARKKYIYNHPEKLRVAEEIIAHRPNNKIITFSASVAAAERFKDGFVYTGKDSKKANRITLNEFNKMPSGIIHSVKLAEEGFDVQDLSVGIMLGVNSSKTKHAQTRGRVVRYHEGKEAEFFTLILKDTVEVEWWRKSNGMDKCEVVDEENLMKILRHEPYETYKEPLKSFVSRF